MVGASSPVELGAESVSLKVDVFKSKPYVVKSPCTATGVGRMNASAARRPRTSSSLRLELIRSDVTVSRKLEGVMLRVSVDCVFENEGDSKSSDARASPGEKAPAGTALSSNENIERSSPFH